jgi:predicted dinucleotide-binding enzyme
MRIGIFGAGVMSEALGARWAAAGHDLMIAGRSPDKAQQLATKLGGRAGSFAEVADFAEIAMIAILYQGLGSTLARIGDGLRGKPIIDCNNPVETEAFTLVDCPGGSAAQWIQDSTGGTVIKAFNLCHAAVWALDPPTFDGRRLVTPYCTDDETAAKLAERLIHDTGADPLPAGDLRHAPYLESMAAIVIAQLYGGRPPYTVLNLVDRPAAV